MAASLTIVTTKISTANGPLTVTVKSPSQLCDQRAKQPYDHLLMGVNPMLRTLECEDKKLAHTRLWRRRFRENVRREGHLRYLENWKDTPVFLEDEDDDDSEDDDSEEEYEEDKEESAHDITGNSSVKLAEVEAAATSATTTNSVTKDEDTVMKDAEESTTTESDNFRWGSRYVVWPGVPIDQKQ